MSESPSSRLVAEASPVKCNLRGTFCCAHDTDEKNDGHTRDEKDATFVCSFAPNEVCCRNKGCAVWKQRQAAVFMDGKQLLEFGLRTLVKNGKTEKAALIQKMWEELCPWGQPSFDSLEPMAYDTSFCHVKVSSLASWHIWTAKYGAKQRSCCNMSA